MNSIEVRCFLSVAAERSFTKTAERLFLSQPTISRYVKNLESELGCALLERSTKRVVLTAAGEYYYHMFRSWELDLEKAHKYVSQNLQHNEVTLCLGYPEDWDITDSFYSFCCCLTQNHPQIKFDLQSYGYQELLARVARSEIDMAVAIPSPYFSEYPQLTYKKAEQVEKVLLYSLAHPMAQKENLSVGDFSSSTLFVVEETATHAKKEVRQHIKPHGFEPKFSVQPNIQTLLANVRRGNGVFITNAWAVSEQGTAYRSLPIGEADDIYLVWDKNRCKPEVLFIAQEI